jgi:hypothetical protein
MASSGVLTPGQSLIVSTAMLRVWWLVALPFFNILYGPTDSLILTRRGLQRLQET